MPPLLSPLPSFLHPSLTSLVSSESMKTKQYISKLFKTIKTIETLHLIGRNSNVMQESVLNEILHYD
jgi:hypothetical protein